MLYKDALTVRLATAPEFLEHHPTCYEQRSVHADRAVDTLAYLDRMGITGTRMFSQCIARNHLEDLRIGEESSNQSLPIDQDAFEETVRNTNEKEPRVRTRW